MVVNFPPVVRVDAYYTVSVVKGEYYRIATIIKASSCCCLGSGPRPCGSRPRPPASYAPHFYGRGHGSGGIHTSPVSSARDGFGPRPSCPCATRCSASGGAGGGDGVRAGASAGACAIPGAGAGVPAGAGADDCRSSLGTS